MVQDIAWNNETTFLIHCVKSENFAIEVKNKLINSYYTKITTYLVMVGSYF